MSPLIEKNIHSLIKIAFTTFSSLSFIANCFLITHRINTALYFSNVMSLILATVMIIIYPDFLYDKYSDLFLGYFNKTAINITGILVHIIPVYLFRNRQRFDELLKLNTIMDSALLLFVYYLLFRQHLYAVYPLSEYELMFMSICYYLVWIVIQYLT